MKLKSAISFRRTICALAALAAGAGLAGPGLAATLQSNVTVQGDVVHLGDIFRDAGKYADRVVIQAPEPGRKVILNVNWLYRVARNYKVDWRPFSRLDQATVERASLLISTQQIRETLTTSLKSEIGRNETIDVDLDNRTLQFYLPAEASQSVKVQSLRVDPRSRRFSAVLLGGQRTSRPARHNVSGRYHRLVKVPVPVRRFRSGEIIRKSDLRFLTVRADKIDANAFLDPGEIIGMSPRRSIAAQRPVRMGDIRAPILVGKGTSVTMIFRTKRMRLTAQGRALEHGSKGETIRIQNMKTRKIIDATVIGSGTVSVLAPGRVALK